MVVKSFIINQRDERSCAGGSRAAAKAKSQRAERNDHRMWQDSISRVTARHGSMVIIQKTTCIHLERFGKAISMPHHSSPRPGCHLPLIGILE